MFGIKNIKKQAGQAMVEYALLLAVIGLTAVTFMQIDETVKFKLDRVAVDLLGQGDITPTLPPLEIECEPDCTPDLKLSPPVAEFDVPSPNYKGRQIRLINQSFDYDGVVEHYIWNIQGRGEIRQGRFDAEKDDGLILDPGFRYSGTYTVNLQVIDNDGLVSNVVSKTVTVVNRSPWLNMTVRNPYGDVSSDSVDVYLQCGSPAPQASFFTDYGDPDLPYEELTISSSFTDATGVTTNYTTVPNQFTRDIINEGTYTYTVTIRDEDGATVSNSVRVIAKDERGPCTTSAAVEPTCTVSVSGHSRFSNGIYYFDLNTQAQITVNPTWGTYSAHTTPYYWRTESDAGADPALVYANTGNTWNSTTKWGTIYRPYQRDWEAGDKGHVVTVIGHVRDQSATSNQPDGTLPGISNSCSARVALDPNVVGSPPNAVVSINNSYSTDNPPNGLDFSENVAFNSSGSYGFGCKENECEKSMNSRHSYVNTRPSNSTVGDGDRLIKGVRWRIPDPNGVPGSGKYIWKPTAAERGTAGVIEVTDVNGYTELWYAGLADSPDSKTKIKFVYGKAPEGPFNNIWEYQLQVISQANITSSVVRKRMILTKKNDPPTLKCSPSSVTVNVGESLYNKLSASGSSDPEGQPVQVWWSLDNNNWSGPYRTTDSVPQSFSFNSAGSKSVYLKGSDGFNTPTITCSVTVRDNNYKLDLEFWDIYNRAKDKGTDIVVYDKTTPKDKVKRDYFKFNCQSDHSKDNCGNTVKGVANGTGNQWNTSVNVSSGDFVGTISVNLFATDTTGASGKPNCTNSSYHDRTLSGVSGYFCQKGAVYFRFGKLNLSRYNPISGTNQSCQTKTVDTDLITYDHYDENFGRWLRTEKTVSADGRTTYYVKDEVKAALNSNCYSYSGTNHNTSWSN